MLDFCLMVMRMQLQLCSQAPPQELSVQAAAEGVEQGNSGRRPELAKCQPSPIRNEQAVRPPKVPCLVHSQAELQYKGAMVSCAMDLLQYSCHRSWSALAALVRSQPFCGMLIKVGECVCGQHKKCTSVLLMECASSLAVMG